MKLNIPPYIASGTTSAVLAKHDLWLNQSVTDMSDVIFQNIHITGNTILDGNLSVLGSRDVSESSTVTYKSHILMINDGEVGSGVFLDEAGLEIDRGQLENVRIVFKESDKMFRVGKLSNTQAIATREDVPLSNGIMCWNSADNRMVSTNILTNATHFTSSVSIDGISTFGNDVLLNGQLILGNSTLYTDTNQLIIKNTQAVKFDTPNVKIPDLTPFWFGDNFALYSDSNKLFVSTGRTQSINFLGQLEATSKSDASIILEGGIVCKKNLLFPGADIELILSASNSNKLRLSTTQNSLTPTILSLECNPTAPNSELQVYGPDRYATLKYNNNGAFRLGTSNGPLSLCSTFINSNQLTLNTDGSVSFQGYVLLADPTPTLPNHVPSKLYIDNQINRLTWKYSVTVATTQQCDISDLIVGSTVDDVTLASGDRILVKDSADPILNGIWVIVDGARAIRSLDMSKDNIASNASIFVSSGTLNKTSAWVSIDSNLIIGTDAIFFERFTGLGQVITGNALSKNWNEINVEVDSQSIEISNNQLRISSNYANIGLVGGSGIPLSVKPRLPHVIETGILEGNSEWRGKKIDISYGGTNQTTFIESGLVYNENNTLTSSPSIKWNNISQLLSVDGNIDVTGSISTSIIDVIDLVTISPIVNISSSTIYSAKVTENGKDVYLIVSLNLTVINGHTITGFSLPLPFLGQRVLTDPLEAFCLGNGYCIDSMDVYSLENLVLLGMRQTQNIRVQFTSNSSSLDHYLQIRIQYQQ